jgi:hypothetical protein
MAAEISVEDCARETYIGRTSTSARTRGSGVCRYPRCSSSEPAVEHRDEHARERAARDGSRVLTARYSNVADTLKNSFSALSLSENIIKFNGELEVILKPNCTSRLKIKGNLEGKSSTFTATSINEVKVQR